MSASALLSRQVLQAAALAGVPAAEVATAAGLELALLADPDARVPHPVHLGIWRQAARLSGDPLFGYRVATGLPPSAYGALGYALASSEDLEAAWRRLAAFSSLLYDELALSREDAGGITTLRYSLLGGEGPPELFQAAVSSLVLTSARLTGGRFLPLEVRLRDGRPRPELGRLLGVKVRFGQEEDALLAPSAALRTPLVGADAGLASVLERHLRDLVDQRPAGDPLIEAVRRFVASALPDGPPSLQRASARLGVGPRTLQRRLAERGSSWRGLVDALRCELAREHLQDPSRSIAEIGFLLGFSEPNAFHKAFRRWTGKTPGEVRRRRASGGG